MDAADAGGVLGILACSYGLGSVLFGPIVARRHCVDLRAVGSGNPGATNVERCLGKRAARVVLLLDASKGLVPVVAGSVWLGPEVAALAGLAAVVGHCFPALAPRDGGKGVATALGALLALHPWAGAASVGTYLVARRATRYASVGSLAGVAAGTLTVLARTDATVTAASVAAMASLIVWRHRENLARLRAGTEPRVHEAPPDVDED